MSLILDRQFWLLPPMLLLELFALPIVLNQQFSTDHSSHPTIHLACVQYHPYMLAELTNYSLL